MAANGKRITALDNSHQFNHASMNGVMPMDLSTSTEPWIHDEHHLGRRRVLVSDLVATQAAFNPDKVKAMSKRGRRPGLPTVVVTDDGLLVHDGHHRLISAVQKGQGHVYVDAYDGRSG